MWHAYRNFYMWIPHGHYCYKINRMQMKWFGFSFMFIWQNSITWPFGGAKSRKKINDNFLIQSIFWTIVRTFSRTNFWTILSGWGRSVVLTGELDAVYQCSGRGWEADCCYSFAFAWQKHKETLRPSAKKWHENRQSKKTASNNVMIQWKFLLSAAFTVTTTFHPSLRTCSSSSTPSSVTTICLPLLPEYW